jgi:ubiquitin-like modifier-activating enzyme ATG7
MDFKYAPFGSEIELPFYSALSTLKIDYDRLDAPTRHVLGIYEPPFSVTSGSCRMQILGNALTSNV